jgi:hypothetical protein
MKIDVSLTEKSIQDAIDKLERYKDRLQDKCIAFVGELASNGIAVAQANTGNLDTILHLVTKLKTQQTAVQLLFLQQKQADTKYMADGRWT